MIKPDTKSAIDFLQWYAPSGPWVLTSISTDRQGVGTQTFEVGEMEAMERWVEKFNGDRNIYFHVNPVTRRLKKKAEREDIKELAWLHIDIDPRVGEDLEDERKRCLGLLTDNLPQGVPEPSCIIFSGGGYQGFWRLEEPVSVDGNLDRAEDAKLWNLQLERIFQGDSCHNIDRIMRLPGTVNIPDAKKQKKGRVEILAELVSHNDKVYPISDFSKAAKVQDDGASGAFSNYTGETVKLSDDIPRVMDLAELDKWNVPNRVKVIIAQGRHPEERKEGDNSRSAWLFDAVCQLVRSEVPDDVIYSLITDPDWGISESVIELKGNRPKRYATRTIERAKEMAKDPNLTWMNERFAVIESIGGKCRIMEEIQEDEDARPKLVLQSFQDFTNRWCHKSVQIGTDDNGVPIKMPMGKWWIHNSNRRQYHTITFRPGKDTPGHYNLWKGFACDALPGDCSLMLKHIKNNLCRGSEENYNYLIAWLARMVQFPNLPGETALVLQGGKGTGKSFFATQIGRLLGRHFMQVANAAHLTGNFNAHLRDLVLLFADEAFFAGDKKHESILMTIITETHLTVERKGVDVEPSPNYLHLIMASNSKHVVPAGAMERRYFVLDVGAEHQQDAAYFAAVAKQMDNGGREALLHYLLSYDLSNFQVRAVPQTEALSTQKDMTLSPMEDWWYEKLQSGELYPETSDWPRRLVITDFFDDWLRYADHRRLGERSRPSKTALGKFRRDYTGVQETNVAKVTREVETDSGFIATRSVATRVAYLPSLDECRQIWEATHGKVKWEAAETIPMALNQPEHQEPF